MVADAYANYIFDVFHKKSKIVLVGMNVKLQNVESYSIISVPNLDDGKIKRIWKRLYYGGNLFCLSPLYKHVKNVRNNFIFVFNDTEPITNKVIKCLKKKHNKIVLVEEGIGTYAVSNIRKKTLSEKIRVLFTGFLGSKMQYRAIGDNKLIDYVIVGNPNLYNSLAKSLNKVVIQQSKNKIFSCASNFLQTYYEKISNDTICEILFLGQPIVEKSGMLPMEQDLMHMVLTLAEKKKVMIKPHPRDINGKYNKLAEEFDNVSVLDGNCARIPIECLVAHYKPRIVLTIASSAAINLANMMPTIKAVMLYKLDICEELNKIVFGKSSYYDDNIFVGANDNLFAPTSLNELKNLIESNIQSDELKLEDSSKSFTEIDLLADC